MTNVDKDIDGLYNAALHYAEAVRLGTRRKVLKELLEVALTECDNIGQMRIRLHRLLHEALDATPEPTPKPEGR